MAGLQRGRTLQNGLKDDARFLALIVLWNVASVLAGVVAAVVVVALGR